MRKLKLTILTALAVFAMWSCKETPINNDPKDKEGGNEEQKANFDFSLTLDTQKDIQTIQVGDMLPITVNIKDTNPGKNMIYVLKPIGKDPNKHQELKKDYRMYNRNYILYYKEINKVEIDYFAKEKTFRLKPIVPGTFQLDFEMQKYDTIQKKSIGKPVVQTFLFSAVKIKFYTSIRRDPNKKDYYQRFYWFSIFDGDNKYDNYLSNYNNVKKMEYITKQVDKGGWSGEFKASKERNSEPYRMEFRHNDGSKKYDSPINNSNVDIKITKHKEVTNSEGVKTIESHSITYKDLTIEYSPMP
ncbi:MAG: hypothetical protein Q4A56_05215 [Porphyromonadaceae bacterium]|nr:hypothetical protein [Porphyromonadaceae bacterium]